MFAEGAQPPQVGRRAVSLGLALCLAIVLCGSVARAQSVAFINPGKSDEVYWVTAAQAMQAAARSLGIDPAHYRLAALGFSAVVAALGGIVAAYSEHPLDATHFAVFLSLQYFLYTVIGGARSLAGAAVVVFAFEVAPALHRGTPPTGPASVLVLGALAALTVAFVPGGLAFLREASVVIALPDEPGGDAELARRLIETAAVAGAGAGRAKRAAASAAPPAVADQRGWLRRGHLRIVQ